MNPETKIILNEMSKKFSELESKFDTRIAEAEKKMESMVSNSKIKWEERISKADDQWERRFADTSIAQDKWISALEREAGSLEDWRPDIEGTVDDMRLEVRKLNKH
ncbi:unnamed protein product [Urochloa humidicola]